MIVIETAIEGVLLIEPDVHGDDRGFFMESWNERAFVDLGLELSFVQDNHSRSNRGVLRGLHYQLPHPQGKLVRVTRGAVFDVVVDLRKSSPTFGRWAGFALSEKNRLLLWVPPGMAHGFLTLEDNTDFLYKCTNFYVRETEHSLLWSDPALGIDWPLGGSTPTLSNKDAIGVSLKDAALYP